MLQYDELRLKLENLRPDLEDLENALGISQIKREVAELEQRAAAPGFWDNMENAQKVTQRTAQLKDKMEGYEKLVARHEDTLALIELANEEEDETLLEECEEGVKEVEEGIEAQRLATLLTGEYDAKNAIVTFHAGAGGTEAQDWAEMLYRMYTHWAETRGFNYRILDYLDGDEAGIKSASIMVEGENAYGYLKSESGVHRLVRVSPFDASGRRQAPFTVVSRRFADRVHGLGRAVLAGRERGLAVRGADAGAGMLVVFRGLGPEREHMCAGMVLVVGDGAVHRPEVGVDIEEVHIDGYLDALSLEVLVFHHPVDDDDLSVRHGADCRAVADLLPPWYTEEVGDEHAHAEREDSKRPSDPVDVDEVESEENQNCADCVYACYRSV